MLNPFHENWSGTSEKDQSTKSGLTFCRNQFRRRSLVTGDRMHVPQASDEMTASARPPARWGRSLERCF